MKKRSIFLLAGIATLYFNNTYAQEKTPQDSTRTASIDQVVITGNSNPKKKIESSTAISTFTAKNSEAKPDQCSCFIAESSRFCCGNFGW
jgi:ABC-type transporter MlaC component